VAYGSRLPVRDNCQNSLRLWRRTGRGPAALGLRPARDISARSRRGGSKEIQSYPNRTQGDPWPATIVAGGNHHCRRFRHGGDGRPDPWEPLLTEDSMDRTLENKQALVRGFLLGVAPCTP
jgi:hypothetical protein